MQFLHTKLHGLSNYLKVSILLKVLDLWNTLQVKYFASCKYSKYQNCKYSTKEKV